MNAKDVITLLKELKVEKALKAADDVGDKREMAAKLTEFAGSLNYLKGLPDLTEVLLKKSLLLDYENPYTHYNIGVLFSSMDKLDEYDSLLEKAELAFKNALKYKSDFHQARYNLALLYYFTGRVEDAEKEYKRIIEAVGDDILYRELGMMLAAEKHEW